MRNFAVIDQSLT